MTRQRKVSIIGHTELKAYSNITINQVCGELIILHLLICLFYPLQCDIIRLTGLIITQAIHLLLAFWKSRILLSSPEDFNILNLKLLF